MAVLALVGITGMYLSQVRRNGVLGLIGWHRALSGTRSRPWAAALLAVGGVVSVVLALMPDAFYRFLAFPNGIAMIGLGYSLWATASATMDPGTRPASRPATAVIERQRDHSHPASARAHSPRP